MICLNCKSNIPNDSKFCPDCGTPISIDKFTRKVVPANLMNIEHSALMSRTKQQAEYWEKQKELAESRKKSIAELAHYNEILSKHNYVVAPPPSFKNPSNMFDSFEQKAIDTSHKSNDTASGSSCMVALFCYISSICALCFTTVYLLYY